MPNIDDETHFYPLKNGDPHYEAIGRVASTWAYFDFHVSQLIWWLSAVDDERGACLTSNMLSINMRMNTLLSLLELETQIHPELQEHDGRPRPYTLPWLLKEMRDLNNKRISPVSKERNRIVHDTWMYGKTTGTVAQIRATAEKKLDYGFRPASIEEVNEAHRKILRLDQEFLSLAGEIRERLLVLRQQARPEQPPEVAPPNPGP